MNPDETAKGFVNLLKKPDQYCSLQYTCRRASLKVGQPWSDRKPLTQRVFIGSRVGVDDAWLGNQLSSKF